MNFKYFLAVLVLITGLGVFVFAQTPMSSPPPIVVNANSCTETDGGLNYFSRGTVSGSFWWLGANNTNMTYVGNLTDACSNSTVLLEGVCGSSVNSSLSGLAGALYVNCAMTNPTYGCVNGACVFVGNNTNTTLPNLIITNITSFSTITNGTNGTNYTVDVYVQVKNIGTGNAGPSSTGLKFGSYPVVQIPTLSMVAGQTRLISKSYSLVVGNYFTVAGADNTTMVVESNEFDNIASANLIIP